ncbi:hypothetical protein [Flavobacterium sp. NRK1]|uniref:hypothetical protein n=1 Tax=Flavobacterium sp. NRK1 TaxID=2954929 RepID=UPI00209326D1|nr:hypothetical protein [Flavobacterium sp. NRK1]MCO6148152.1 hypothetical protein [Flavobacterium sp. NRK1]
MKLRYKRIPLTVVLIIFFTITGCSGSKKIIPKADYHLLTGRKITPHTKRGIKNESNTLLIGKRLKFTLAATDSVTMYPSGNKKIYSNYKELFANVNPNTNYKVTIHTLPDTHMSTNKYVFIPIADVFDKLNAKLEITTVENKWANDFEKPGIKGIFTFNSGNSDEIAIVVAANNKEVNKKLYTYIINFITFKYWASTRGDFYITIEEIKEK